MIFCCWCTVAASRVVQSSVLFLSVGLILRSFTYKFNTVSFRFWSTVGFFCCFSYQRRSFDLFSLFCVLHSTRLWISYAALTIPQIIVDRTVYSCRELFGLRRTYPGRLTRLTEILNDIATIGLLRYRGNHAGAKTKGRQVRASVYKHDPDNKSHIDFIDIVPSCRLPRRQSDQSRNRVLVSIECVGAMRSLKIGVLNVQSLDNKSAAVLDTIVNNTLDLFATVESWHDSFNSTSIIASTPPGYRVIERTRVGSKKQANSIKVNDGGICIFVRKSNDATKS